MIKNNIFHIIIRIWFNKKEGNTYHTVNIWQNDKHIKKSNITYGYGIQYRKTALTILQDRNFYTKTDKRGINGSDKDMCRFLDDIMDKKVIFHVTNVMRKKDL